MSSTSVTGGAATAIGPSVPQPMRKGQVPQKVRVTRSWGAGGSE